MCRPTETIHQQCNVNMHAILMIITNTRALQIGVFKPFNNNSMVERSYEANSYTDILIESLTCDVTKLTIIVTRTRRRWTVLKHV